MKQLFFLPIALMLLFTSCTYDNGVSEAFSRYRHKDGVTSITVPGWLIGIAAGVGDLEKEERALLRSISKVRVLTIDDEHLNKRHNFHEEFYLAVAENPGMEELLVVHNDDEQVTIFGKGTEKAFDELLILVGGNSNAIIFIEGKLKAEVISDLMNKESMNGFLSWNQ